MIIKSKKFICKSYAEDFKVLALVSIIITSPIMLWLVL
ncbi:hypothetical protein Sd1_gp52 [Shigella phage Sd1]|uniref:Uncharacterized protein n=1 Tax=Shigella phage Sd1 TaxID=2024313 RepID=A0A291AYQ1_9CAUD|nr:hypothetical protein HOR98_gp51 [Shigella phage Sd1]ATE86118.1 hypothetical protein Sd1_gp52 [Shigella phage Sd1]